MITEDTYHPSAHCTFPPTKLHKLCFLIEENYKIVVTSNQERVIYVGFLKDINQKPLRILMKGRKNSALDVWAVNKEKSNEVMQPCPKNSSTSMISRRATL